MNLIDAEPQTKPRGRRLSAVLLPGAALTLGLGFSPAASAYSQFIQQIPNGAQNRCATCHTNPSGGTGWNDFGEDVREQRNGSDIDWSALWLLDSDGDGQTNGQELGDPCGTWEAGGTPARTTDISKPGDANDTSSAPVESCDPSGGEAPDAGAPGGDSAPETDAGPDVDGGDDVDAAAGGCSATHTGAGFAPFGFLALLGLGFFTRKRR